MRRAAGLLLIFTFVGCEKLISSPQASAPPPTFDLLAWEYPGARPVARIDPVLIATDKVGREEIASEPREGMQVKAPALYSYDTSDTLEVVYAFYGQKLGLDPEYKPASLGFGETRWSESMKFGYEKRESYPDLRLAYTGLEGRQEVVRTATLVGPGGSGFSVVVVLSRARPEGFTTIELVVTRG